jgi:two-component sensor histidine kinase
MFSPEEYTLARLHQTVMRLQEIAASQEPLTIKRERAAVNLCSLLQEIAATSTPALQAEVTRLIALYMDLR